MITWSNIVQKAPEIAAYVIKHMYATTIARNIVATEDLTGTGERQTKFKTDGSLSASVVNEGANFTESNFSTSVVTVTLAKAGIYINPTIENIRYSNTDKFVNRFPQEATKAIGVKEDTDVFSNLTSLSNAIGTTNIAFDIGLIDDADYILDLTSESKDRYIILSPSQKKDIKDHITTTDAVFYNMDSSKDLVNSKQYGLIGELRGYPVYQTNVLPKVNSNVDVVGGLITKDCIGLAYDDMVEFMDSNKPLNMTKEISIAKFYVSLILKNGAGVSMKSKA